MKTQHKERGEKRRKDDGRVDGGGEKKRKKKVWAKREKKRMEKEREWTGESRGLILALGFFSSSLSFFFQIQTS